MIENIFFQVFQNIYLRWQTISTQPVFSLFFVLVIVWGVGVLFQKLNLPLILGELLAGIVVGPPLLGWIQPSESFKLLAELGAIFMVFFAGLESNLEKIQKATFTSFLIALFGTFFPVVFSVMVIKAFGGNYLEGIFVGTAISTTSLVAKSRILHELNLTRSRLGHVLLGSSIYDNLFSLALFTLLISAGKSGHIHNSKLIVMSFEIFIFMTIVLFAGQKIFPHLGPYFSRREAKGFTFALFIALFFGIIAELIGLHMILGAYLAGLFVREEIMSKNLYQKLYDRFYAISYGFLGPLFFVSLSFYISPQFNWQILWLFLALLFAGIFGKIIGVGLGARLGGLSWVEALLGGIAMNTRGFLEMIFITIGIKMGLVNQVYLTILILIALASIFFTPVILKFSYNFLLKKQSEVH